MTVTISPSSQKPLRTRRTRSEIVLDDIEAIYQKMDTLYALAKVRQSELDETE